MKLLLLVTLFFSTLVQATYTTTEVDTGLQWDIPTGELIEVDEYIEVWNQDTGLSMEMRVTTIVEYDDSFTIVLYNPLDKEDIILELKK